MREIPLLDLDQQYASIKEEIQQAIFKVLRDSQFIMGQDVKDFEQEMAAYCGVKHAIGLASGTDALLLALRAMEIGPADEVIVPTFTFFATAGAVSRLGATPVFADIDPLTYNIDMNEIERLVTERTRAIIPVHLYGQMAEMEKIKEIAKKYDLWILEDACQSIGAHQNEKPVGFIGDAATFSFFPSKNLGAYGDAGMLITNNDQIAQLVKKLRVHGSKPKYYHQIVGYNSRLDTIQAAVLKVKLKYLDEWNNGRRQVAEYYQKHFKEAGLEEIIQLPIEMDNNYHVYHQYVIQTPKRDELQQYLKEVGIGTSVYYPLPLHLQECYLHLGMQKGDLSVAELACQRVLALPIFPELKEENIAYIVNKIKEFFGDEY